MRLPPLVSAVATGLLLLFCVLPAAAQYNSGIEGTPIDASGAPIPDAEGVATNQDTGVKQSTTSDSQGLFRFQNLPPGLYSVEIRAKGFELWKLSDIRLEGNQTRTIYPKLVVG